MQQDNNAHIRAITVCFFNSNPVWGGGEKWFLDSAFRLHQNSYSIHLFAKKGSELLLRSKQAGIPTSGIRVRNLSFMNPLKIILLAWRFRKLGTDVIILNLSSDVKMAGIAARLAGVKKIIYRRGLPIPVADNFMNRFLFRQVLTSVIANSEDIKRKILYNNQNLIAPEKIQVIYNSIDESEDHLPDKLAAVFQNCRGVVIGNAGRLSREKGQTTLIRMATQLKARGIEYSLVIAGEGDMKKVLTDMVKKAGIEKQVSFIGFLGNMDHFYASLDIFVLTSLYEGCSNTLLEAMHHGKPIVAFNNSSIPEIVEHNVNGLLAENENLEDLCDKVAQLAGNKDLRIKFGKAGSLLLREKFSMQQSLRQLEELMKS
jgi:glycosyltransferase involved in cell wall biosynthesis